jgi:hypothetical protein
VRRYGDELHEYRNDRECWAPIIHRAILKGLGTEGWGRSRGSQDVWVGQRQNKGRHTRGLTGTHSTARRQDTETALHKQHVTYLYSSAMSFSVTSSCVSWMRGSTSAMAAAAAAAAAAASRLAGLLPV